MLFAYPFNQRNREKGIRQTSYLGYNEAETFLSNDYGVLPPEADYRRTLFWDPDVELNDKGIGDVDFYNSTTCRKFSVCVDGITTEGKPTIIL